MVVLDVASRRSTSGSLGIRGQKLVVLPVGLHGAGRTVLNASDQDGQGGVVWVAAGGIFFVRAELQPQII